MIIGMKKIRLVVFKEDKETLLRALQKQGIVMLTSTKDVTNSGEPLEEDKLLQRTSQSYQLIARYRPKKKLSDPETVLSYEALTETQPAHLDLVHRIEKINESKQAYETQLGTIQSAIRQLLPWETLAIRLDQLQRTETTLIHLGFVPSREVSKLTTILEERGSLYEFHGLTADGQAVLLINLASNDEAIMASLKEISFNEITLPQSPHTAKDLMNERQNYLNELEQTLHNLTAQLNEAARQINELERLYDQTLARKELKQAPIQETIMTTYIEGWARKDEVDQLQPSLDKLQVPYELDIGDPAPGESPPTATKNNRFVEPYESITNMFARPNPYETDPNPLMAFWYWLIFGMMMGDAGYGLVMVLGFYALIKFTRPKGGSLQLYRLIMYSGYSTILWGILYNSYFGYSLNIPWLPVLVIPMEDPLKVLLICLFLGILHLFSGILMKAYNNFRRKDYLAIFVDQLSWITFLTGVIMLLIPSLLPPEAAFVGTIGQYMALLGAATIVLFAGRSSKNVFARLGLGLYSLYGSSSYLGDILSYSRILAMGLSGAVIGYVMNLLAGMIQGSFIGIIFSIFIYLFGHVLNIVLSLLSAYVHDSRLQYIEFFGKFYEGGGYAFKPFRVDPKYIDKVTK